MIELIAIRGSCDEFSRLVEGKTRPVPSKQIRFSEGNSDPGLSFVILSRNQNLQSYQISNGNKIN
jgi:hypothetical protein